jgi:antitoxin component of MazEF toxin-antitoxin module
MVENKSFTITKRIAKHGNQAVLIIPSVLQGHLKPGILAEIKIEILVDK